MTGEIITATGRALQLIRNEIIEECAKAAEKAWPLGNYPLASENSDVYRGQDHAAQTVVKAIRALAVPSPAKRDGQMMSLNQYEAELLRQFIKREVEPLLERIEALEAAQPPQDQMENYRLALTWIDGQSTDPQAKEIAATALNSFTVSRPHRETP